MNSKTAAQRVGSPSQPAATAGVRGQAQGRRRLIIWGACLISYALALFVVRRIKTATGLDPFSIVLNGFIPVGAAGIATLAIAGYVLAAKYFRWTADRRDFLFLLAACVSLQFSIVTVDYLALLSTQPGIGELSYSRFFALSLTSPEVLSRNGPPKTIGEAGYLLLFPRMGALMALAKYVHSRFARDKAYAV